MISSITCTKSKSNNNNTILGIAYLLANQSTTEEANIEVKGILKDSNEDLITDATLIVTEEVSTSVRASTTTQVTTTSTTDSNGEFTIYIRVGKYKVTVTKNGSEVGSFVLQPKDLLNKNLEPSEMTDLYVFITQALVINGGTNILFNFFEFGLFTKLTGGASGTYTQASGVSTDSSGNVYVTGYTEDGLDGNTITTSGFSDMFVIKYDSIGNKKWTKQFGTSNGINIGTYGEGITTDGFGNIYITGITDGDLDGNTLTGNTDGYIMKFDSGGNKQWTKQFGISSLDLDSSSISTDTSNNIYITGYTESELSAPSLLLMKFDYQGNQQWIQQVSLSGSDIFGNFLALDSSNNVYVTGDTDTNLEDGSPLSLNYAYLIKYDSDGNKQWIKYLGEDGDSTYGNGISIDSSDNIFVTGYTDAGLAGNTLTGSIDAFVAKYNTDGTQVWVKQIGSGTDSFGTIAYRATTDIFGNVYIAGDTDGDLPGSTLIGYTDAFVVKYNSSGELVSVKQKGVSSFDTYGIDISLDSLGNPAVVGYTDGDLDGESNSSNYGDAFITTSW